MGTIAGYAAIGASIGAVILVVLGLMGLRHARRMEESATAEPTVTGSAPAPVS